VLVLRQANVVKRWIMVTTCTATYFAQLHSVKGLQKQQALCAKNLNCGTKYFFASRLNSHLRAITAKPSMQVNISRKQDAYAVISKRWHKRDPVARWECVVQLGCTALRRCL